jgi:transposase InsO family protein
MWIKIIFAKVDTTSSIKEIKAATEIEVERLLWVLRTDNNGEFTIKEFIAYCTNEGIQHHFSTPYTPQQNGVVECKKQTVPATTCTLLKEREMSVRY